MYVRSRVQCDKSKINNVGEFYIFFQLILIFVNNCIYRKKHSKTLIKLLLNRLKNEFMSAANKTSFKPGILNLRRLIKKLDINSKKEKCSNIGRHYKILNEKFLYVMPAAA
jgi:hypothetical protein